MHPSRKKAPNDKFKVNFYNYYYYHMTAHVQMCLFVFLFFFILNTSHQRDMCHCWSHLVRLHEAPDRKKLKRSQPALKKKVYLKK